MAFPAALSPAKRVVAARLYRSGLSAQQVADRLGVSLNAAFYALRRENVVRRSIVESNRLRFESKAPSYRLKARLSQREEQLKLAAVMLYWAEGYKVGKQTVLDFVNADPTMLILFRRFLSVICLIDEKRLRAHLYCYQDQDAARLTRYWSRLLRIPQSQFIKPYVSKRAGPGPRGPRMNKGLVHIAYCDKKLVRQVLAWIAEYGEYLTK